MSNILITRHDKIGDFVVSLPMFKCLKQARPNDKLIALVAGINVSLAEKIDYIDAVIEYRPKDLNTTLKQIKQMNIDISISAFIDDKLGLLLWRSGIPTRIGPATKLAQVWFNKRIKQRRSEVKKTEVEYNLDLLKALDPSIPLDYAQPLFGFDKTVADQAFQAFCANQGLDPDLPVIAFHPGSGGSTDGNLRIDDYIKLALFAAEQERCQVVFTFGPDDAELYPVVEEAIVKGAMPNQVRLYQSVDSIYDFALILSGFKLFVSTSTGPMHLAAGANITTLSFFGENRVASPSRWASVNESTQQNNFQLSEGYSVATFESIKNRLSDIIEHFDY